MGTETRATNNTQVTVVRPVKLNNPLMGTETVEIYVISCKVKLYTRLN